MNCRNAKKHPVTEPAIMFLAGAGMTVLLGLIGS